MRNPRKARRAWIVRQNGPTNMLLNLRLLSKEERIEVAPQHLQRLGFQRQRLQEQFTIRRIHRIQRALPQDGADIRAEEEMRGPSEIED